MAHEVTFLMAFVLWVAIGLLLGLVFALIIGTGKHEGFLGYVLFGIAGAILSGLFFRALGSKAMLSNWEVNVMAGAVGALILMVMAEYAHRRLATTRVPRRNGRR